MSVLLLLPYAAASGALDLGVVGAGWEDHRARECWPETAVGCALSVGFDESNPTNLSVDAKVRVYEIWITYSGDELERATGLSVLPDDSLRIDASETVLYLPVMKLFTGAHERVPHRDLAPAGVEFHENATYVRRPLDPADPLGEQHHLWVQYDPHGVPYDQAGPYNAMGSTDTDNYAHDAPWFACNRVGPECHALVVDPIVATFAFTPDVEFGFDAYNFTVGNATPPAAPLRGNVSRPVPLLQTSASEAPGLATLDVADAALHPAPSGVNVEPPRRGAAPPTAPSATKTTIQTTSQAPAADVARLAFLAGAVALAAALGVALYSRLVSKELILTSARKRIVAHVGRHPGCTVQDIAAALGTSRTNVVYHLQVLVKAGYVRSTRHDRRVFIFPLGAPEPDVPPAVRTSRVRSALHAALARAPHGLSRHALHAATADFPERTRNHALKALETSGIVRKALTDKGVLYVLTTRARKGAVREDAHAPRGARGGESGSV